VNAGDRIEREHTFTQADFDAFAVLSGDDNPIHVDPEFSARTRFGRTVAHGLLLCSVLRGLVDELAPGARLAEQQVMFPAPTFADEAMRFVVEAADAATVDLRVERLDDGSVTCSGTARLALERAA